MRIAAGHYVVEVDEDIDDIKVDDGVVSLGRGGSELVSISQIRKRAVPYDLIRPMEQTHALVPRFRAKPAHPRKPT